MVPFFEAKASRHNKGDLRPAAYNSETSPRYEINSKTLVWSVELVFERGVVCMLFLPIEASQTVERPACGPLSFACRSFGAEILQ